jgi:hypothetical protein
VSNRLARETSPYLLQHKDNPVDWWPWGAAALDEARRSQRPILLSIGYSACHWCHVMAHESFEDADVARVMNELFVNVKVDREERPDLDRIYQLTHQLLAQRPGGWPLTVLLDAATLTPFFAGTYFPKEPRHGLPAFTAILQRAAEWYRQNHGQMPDLRERIRQVLAQVDAGSADGAKPDRAPLTAARQALEQDFDFTYGGFGGAPKFPHPVSLEFLLDGWRRGGGADASAQVMALLTLRRMAEGGLYDHVGGGFARYSVDERWEIPHFEKMLYDNGPLLALYSHATALDPDPFFAEVASATADWVVREMQSPDGGYYSALDADSEHEEGRFYLWTREQARAVLGDEMYALAAARYGLDKPANFEGRWHLRAVVPAETLARDNSLGPDEARARLAEARRKLFEARAPRVRPGRDDKVLVSWNALAISGMAAAARRLGRADLLASAQRALDFIRSRLWVDGRLRTAWKDGAARQGAYLDDHAFLLCAALDLLEAGWRSADLAFARHLAEALLAHFEDRDHGGFWFTAHDHEALLHRSKPWGDDATPSGNGMAARGLLRLGHLLGEPRYLAAAERTLHAAAEPMARHPVGHATLLLALAEFLEPAEVVILRGAPDKVAPWQQALARRPAGGTVFAIGPDAADLPEALAGKSPRGDAVAYVCRGTQCAPPVTRLEELVQRPA